MGTRFSVTMLALLTSSMVAGMTIAAQRGAPATQQTTQTYRAPRTKDNKPDLNGIWQAVNEANWDIEGHGAAPGPFWRSAPNSPFRRAWESSRAGPFRTSRKRSRRKRRTLRTG